MQESGIVKGDGVIETGGHDGPGVGLSLRESILDTLGTSGIGKDVSVVWKDSL